MPPNIALLFLFSPCPPPRFLTPMKPVTRPHAGASTPQTRRFETWQRQAGRTLLRMLEHHRLNPSETRLESCS